MASVESSEIKEEFEFMGDFFKLRKKYYIPENNDDYWHQLNLEVNELAKKYDYKDYFVQLLLIMVDEIDKRAGNHMGDGYKALWNRLRGKKDGMEQTK